MIFPRKVQHPFRPLIKIIEHVCTCCGNIHTRRPNDNKCRSCRR